MPTPIKKTAAPKVSGKKKPVGMPQRKDPKDGRPTIWDWTGSGATTESKPKKSKPSPTTKPLPADDALTTDERDISDLIVQNPGISAPAFLNLIKSKGYKIVSSVDDSSLKVAAASAAPDKEADSASSTPATLRSGVKPKKESTLSLKGRTFGEKDKFNRLKFRESAASDNGIGPTRFEVVLIQEGLGNLKDCFYYSRPALESAIPLFTGKKFFVDHPDAIEEQARPERSVKDVAGYFENLRVEDGDEGQAQLVGDLVTFPDQPYAWVRALIREALAFQKNHPDKDLVGLSINASGSSQPMKLTEFMDQAELPRSALPKLKRALEEGVTEVKVVTAFVDSTSCDLVTEAGAGGKFLKMLEAKEKVMGPKQKQAEEAGDDKDMKKPPAKDAAGDDKELVKKMLKKHMGQDDDQDDGAAEEDEESEESEDDSEEAKKDDDGDGDDDSKEAEEDDGMEDAMEAYEAAKGMGFEGEEAAKMACAAVKIAKAMKQKKMKQAKAEEDDGMEAKTDAKGVAAESDDDSEEAATDKKGVKIESARKLKAEVMKLKGELASLREAGRKNEVAAYLEQKLASSKLPYSVTKTFKESIGAPKSKKEVDDALTMFMEGYRLNRGETGSGINFQLAAEKTVGKTGVAKAKGLSGCLK